MLLIFEGNETFWFYFCWLYSTWMQMRSISRDFWDWQKMNCSKKGYFVRIVRKSNIFGTFSLMFLINQKWKFKKIFLRKIEFKNFFQNCFSNKLDQTSLSLLTVGFHGPQIMPFLSLKFFSEENEDILMGSKMTI